MSAAYGGDTPEGQQAYALLEDVFNDRTSAATAQKQVDDLARRSTGQALREVQDVGTILARLAKIPVTGRTISSQMGDHL